MVISTGSPSSRSITPPRILVTAIGLPSSGGAERHRQSRLDERQFHVEPPAAGPNLAGIRLGVNASLAAGFELEVLHRVGDIGNPPVDPGLFKDLVENHPGRTHKRPA